MKTLADIKKRLTVGRQMLCVQNTYRPDLNGTTRTITRVLTNQIVWVNTTGDTRPSWTRWPSAKNFTFHDADTFSFKLFPDRADVVTLRFLGDGQ